MTSSRQLIFSMDASTKRKQIVDDVFSATGAKMEHDDPLVIAALYYSHEMRAASSAVSAQLQQVAGELRAAAQLAVAANASVAADRAKFMRDVESHIVKCLKQASKAQPDLREQGRVPTWYALSGALIMAVIFSTGWTIAAAYGSVQAEEAAVGRAFNRVAPTLDPKIKAQLYERLRNPG
jgi:hypothetical protein